MLSCTSNLLSTLTLPTHPPSFLVFLFFLGPRALSQKPQELNPKASALSPVGPRPLHLPSLSLCLSLSSLFLFLSLFFCVTVQDWSAVQNWKARTWKPFCDQWQKPTAALSKWYHRPPSTPPSAPLHFYLLPPGPGREKD